MRTKKQIVEQVGKKQKQPEIREVRPVNGGNDFWKRYVFSLERKSGDVTDDNNGEGEGDEGEED